MIPQKLDNLKSRVADRFENMLHSEVAEHFADQAVEKMVDEGEAMILSEDEESLIHAYRRFKTRSLPRSQFKWRTPEASPDDIVVAQTPSLIVHPNEV